MEDVNHVMIFTSTYGHRSVKTGNLSKFHASHLINAQRCRSSGSQEAAIMQSRLRRANFSWL